MTKPARKLDPCAACGATKTVRATTFMVDRPGCRGEFHICARCWNEGQNDEGWNETITERIILRHKAKALESRQPRKLTPATTLCGPVPKRGKR